MADALIAYEGVFQDVLRGLHGKKNNIDNLNMVVRWRRSLGEFDALAHLSLRYGRIILINAACFSDLQGGANYLFRHPEFMPDFGAASQEPGDTDGADDRPLCPLRREAAQVVAENGLCIIFLHELGHHALGHLDACLDMSFRSVRHESISNSKLIKKTAAAQFHVDELEADLFAFDRVVDLTSRNSPVFSRQLLTQPLLRERLFELTIIAHALVTVFLGELGDAIADYDLRDHPHPALRLICAQTWLAKMVLAGRVDPIRAAGLTGTVIRLLATFHEGSKLAHTFAHGRDEMKAQLNAAIELAVDREHAGKNRYDFSAGHWHKHSEASPLARIQ